MWGTHCRTQPSASRRQPRCAPPLRCAIWPRTMARGGNADRRAARHRLRASARASSSSIVGPSGCGKSTLLKILAGLLPASAGEALLNGTPIDGPRRDIGMVFQSPVLFPWRSVLGNVLLPVDVQRLGREQHDRSARSTLIALVGLVRLRAPLSLGAVGRHAAARRARARADPRPGAAADGRAVRRARRDDARVDERRAAAHLAGAAQDRGVHHAFDQRGGVPRRPRDGDDAAARHASATCSRSTCRARARSTS